MRLPLNITGVPFTLSDTPSTDVTILDIAGAPEGLSYETRYLTLYALLPQGDGATVTVLFENSVGTQTEIAAVTSGAVTGSAFQATLLERFPMRGDVQVVARTAAATVDQPVLVYGYYEFEDSSSRVQNVPPEFRPLEPVLGSVGNNIAPYDYLPFYADDVTGPDIVHAFSPDYIDTVDLFFGGAFFLTPSMIIYDGGNRIAYIPELATEQPGVLAKLFDGIPFRAASVPSTLFPTLNAGIHVSTSSASDIAFCWGRFSRS